MKLPRKQAVVVRDAIERWKQDGVIHEAQAITQAATIEVQYFNWRKLAKYSFWIALFSIVSSVSAAFSDRWLIDLLQRLFDTPPIARCVLLATASGALYRCGLAGREQAPDKAYSNEQFSFSGSSPLRVVG